jgi:4-hydroxy-tetrahydrodipicolinate synthase
MDHLLAGLHVPLVTPLTVDGQLASGALERLAHHVLDAGAAGLVALGTTGEPATLTPAERRTVLDVCARVCRERGATLIAGAGSNDTAASVDAVRELAAWPEVSAALTVAPYYTRPSEDGVVAHFAAVAAAGPVPLVAYHVPYRTGRTLGWQALRRIAELPGVVGMKYAAGVDEDTIRLMADLPDGFALLAGDDLFASPLLALGAAGAILASAHICTSRFAELVEAWRTADVGRARALGHRLAPLSAALFAEPSPAVIKAVLHARGHLPSPAVRLPLLPAGRDATETASRLADEVEQLVCAA